MQQENIKTRYNDTELNEFKTLIREKITMAREELTELAGTLSSSNSNGDDAAIAGKTLEDGQPLLRRNRPISWLPGRRSLSSNSKLH